MMGFGRETPWGIGRGQMSDIEEELGQGRGPMDMEERSSRDTTVETAVEAPVETHQ
jgi:hypothetical protein